MLNLLALRALPWRLIGLSALAVAFALLFAALQMEKRHSGKLKSQLEKCESFRKQLADESDRWQKETARRVAQAKERIVYVDRVVTRLESRALPGQCQTPDRAEWGDIL